MNEIRLFYDKTIVLAGSFSNGSDIAAAQVMGANLAYMGTRFIATLESSVQEQYKQQLLQSSAADIVYTPVIFGVSANFIHESIAAVGIGLEQTKIPIHLDFGAEMDVANKDEETTQAKPWKDIWSAGQGISSIDDLPACADLVARLIVEYKQALVQQQEKPALLTGENT